MANSKKTELATVGSFELTVNRFEGLSPEDLEELKDQMEDLDQDTGIACRLIKIPSGGKLAYEVQTGEDETDVDYMKEVEGVIIFTHRLNGYWPGAFGTDDNKVPACSSMDGKTAVWTDTGEVRTCENCPLNQYGSDDNPNGTGKGKACKNVHRVFILREGNPVPLVLSLPPTSLKYMRDYIAKRVILKGFRCWQAVTKITLKKEKNAAGIAYSRAVFTFVGKLSPEKAKEAEAMKDCVKQQYRQLDVEGADYNATAGGSQDGPAAPKTDEAGFMNIPDGIDEDLPFN